MLTSIKRHTPDDDLLIPHFDSRQYGEISGVANEDAPLDIVIELDSPIPMDVISYLNVSDGMAKSRVFLGGPFGHILRKPERFFGINRDPMLNLFLPKKERPIDGVDIEGNPPGLEFLDILHHAGGIPRYENQGMLAVFRPINALVQQLDPSDKGQAVVLAGDRRRRVDVSPAP